MSCCLHPDGWGSSSGLWEKNHSHKCKLFLCLSLRSVEKLVQMKLTDRVLHSTQATDPIKAACEYVRCCLLNATTRACLRNRIVECLGTSFPPRHCVAPFWQEAGGSETFCITLSNYRVYFSQTFWKGNSLFGGHLSWCDSLQLQFSPAGMEE